MCQTVFEFAAVVLQESLQLLVQLYFVLNEQDAEEKFVHTFAYGIHVHVSLCSLNLALQFGNFLLGFHVAAIPNDLVQVKSQFVLVFAQSLVVIAVGFQHVTQHVRQVCRIGLVRSLTVERQLR